MDCKSGRNSYFDPTARHVHARINPPSPEGTEIQKRAGKIHLSPLQGPSWVHWAGWGQPGLAPAPWTPWHRWDCPWPLSPVLLLISQAVPLLPRGHRHSHSAPESKHSTDGGLHTWREPHFPAGIHSSPALHLLGAGDSGGNGIIFLQC